MAECIFCGQQHRDQAVPGIAEIVWQVCPNLPANWVAVKGADELCVMDVGLKADES
jgi:hypothetical protein